MKFNKFVVAAMAIGLSSATLAQSIGKPEDQIRWRQSVMQTLGWSMGRIKANIEGTYNKDQVIQAANTIQALANSGSGALFAPGTDKGKGWHDTEVKPELFTNTAKLREVGSAYNKEANELAKVAAGGDAAAVKAQFGNLGKACKACHDEFRKEQK
ncbi:MAG: cytochrome c [Rhodocyclales bacterium]|nr:cytochrome c [Rhodocyclales bacterium]